MNVIYQLNAWWRLPLIWRSVWWSEIQSRPGVQAVHRCTACVTCPKVLWTPFGSQHDLKTLQKGRSWSRTRERTGKALIPNLPLLQDALLWNRTWIVRGERISARGRWMSVWSCAALNISTVRVQIKRDALIRHVWHRCALPQHQRAAGQENRNDSPAAIQIISSLLQLLPLEQQHPRVRPKATWHCHQVLGRGGTTEFPKSSIFACISSVPVTTERNTWSWWNKGY